MIRIKVSLLEKDALAPLPVAVTSRNDWILRCRLKMEAIYCYSKIVERDSVTDTKKGQHGIKTFLLYST